MAASLPGSVLNGALCLDDFDGDGEDEVAVGTATGKLLIFKYDSTSQPPQVGNPANAICR